jgi:uncharacterized membrane protein
MVDEVIGPDEDEPDEPDGDGLEGDALNEVREVAAQEAQQQVRRSLELSYHAGPLPPAADYALYEEADPGTARWIRDTTEREQRQRHGMERVGLYASVGVRYLGMLLAAGISILVVLKGADLIEKDKDVAGLILLLAGLGPIIAAFLFRRNSPPPQLPGNGGNEGNGP